MFKYWISHRGLIGAALALASLHAAAQSPAQPPVQSGARIPAGGDRNSYTADELAHGVIAGRVLLQRNLPGVACDLIKRMHGEATQSPDALYVLAVCSRMLGNTAESIGYYERLVHALPDAPRPKAELAVLYASQGRQDEARVLYRQAADLQKGTDAALLLRQLAGTEAAEDPAKVQTGPKRWQIDLYGGMVRDSNINAGPSSSSIAAVIGGVPVTLALDDASMPKEETGYNLTAGGRYLHALSDQWAILYQGSLSASDYFGTDSYNTESLAAGAALIYKQPSYSVSVQPNARYVRQDDRLQEATLGISGRVAKTVSPSMEVFGTLGYFDRRVPLADFRSGDGRRVGAGVNYALRNGIQIGGEYIFQRESAQAASESRDLHGPSIYAVATPLPRLDVLASYRYTSTQHDAPQLLFSDAREDRQNQAGVTASYKLPGPANADLRLVTEYSFTRNKSTIGLYDYTRRVLTVGLQARF